MSERERFGRLIAVLREWRGMTKRRVTIRAGISMSYLWQIENGQRIPSLATRERIAGVLGCSLPQLEALEEELNRRLS